MRAHEGGDGDASDGRGADWRTEVYRLLRQRAARELRDPKGLRTLSPTDVVHEVFLRMREQHSLPEQHRPEFLALASRMMRRVLVDHARRRRRLRRGGDRLKLPLDAVGEPGAGDDGGEETDLVALDVALHRLEQRDAESATIVELRYFGGLSWSEVCEATGLPDRTARLRWEQARAWLYQQIRAGA